MFVTMIFGNILTASPFILFCKETAVKSANITDDDSIAIAIQKTANDPISKACLFMFLYDMGLSCTMTVDADFNNLAKLTTTELFKYKPRFCELTASDWNRWIENNKTNNQLKIFAEIWFKYRYEIIETPFYENNDATSLKYISPNDLNNVINYAYDVSVKMYLAQENKNITISELIKNQAKKLATTEENAIAISNGNIFDKNTSALTIALINQTIMKE